MAKEVIDNLFTFLSTGFLEKETLKKMEVEWSRLHEPFLEGKKCIRFKLEKSEIIGQWNPDHDGKKILWFWIGPKRTVIYEDGYLSVNYKIKCVHPIHHLTYYSLGQNFVSKEYFGDGVSELNIEFNVNLKFFCINVITDSEITFVFTEKHGCIGGSFKKLYPQLYREKRSFFIEKEDNLYPNLEMIEKYKALFKEHFPSYC
jgi:hypothetical protein